MRNAAALFKLAAASLFCFLICGLLVYMEFHEDPHNGPTFKGLIPGIGAGLVGLILGALVVLGIVVSAKSPPTTEEKKEREKGSAVDEFLRH